VNSLDPVLGSAAEVLTASQPWSGAQSVIEWLESPYLSRVATRVACHYGLPSQDTPDLLQDLRIALWKAGPSQPVNVAWIFHTANHKAVDFVKRRIRLARETSAWAEDSPERCEADPTLRHLLRARAARLPKRLHDFYLLRYEEGLSQREIARRLGVCRSSVRCLDRECLRRVKGRLVVAPKHGSLLGRDGVRLENRE